MTKWSLDLLTPDGARAAERMTFPAFRHLLTLEPSPRHPAEGDLRQVQPIAIGAWVDGSVAGMALAESPIDDAPAAVPTLLSVFVEPSLRRQGIATSLVREAERHLIQRGHATVSAVYMTGSASTVAVEAMLARCGWSAPVTRAMTMRATIDELRQMPWYGRVRLPSPGFAVFPWTELRPDDKRRLASSQVSKPWITEGLEPWRHDHAGFDEVSSVGLRHRDEVVGWVINHRLAGDVVRFSGAFVREDHGRRGRVFALYTESIERLRGTPCREITCITPARYAAHAAFLRDRCGPTARFFGETRGSEKRLA